MRNNQTTDMFEESARELDGQKDATYPTLVKILPQPFRQLVGDLSDKKEVLVALDLRKAD